MTPQDLRRNEVSLHNVRAKARREWRGMPKASKTGVRGLTKNADGRYEIDIRWRDPSTGRRRRHRKTLDEGITGAAARRYAHDINSRVLLGTYRGHADIEHTLYELFDEYEKWSATDRPKSYADKCSHIRIIKRHLADLPLHRLAPLDLERVKQARREAECAPATINKVLATFKHAISYGTEQLGWLTTEQHRGCARVKKLKEPPGRVRYFQDDEEERIMAALPPFLVPIVHAAIATGMRLSELRTLQRSQVDLSQKQVLVGNKHETKTGKVRVIPIRGTGLQVFRELLASHREESVFLGPDKAPFKNRHGIGRPFAAAVKRAQVSDFHFHDLRHEFATRLRRNGVELDALAKLMGHSTIQMTMRYAHIGDETLGAAIERMQGGAPASASGGLKLVVA